MGMTIGEQHDLLRDELSSLLKINNTLRRANGLACYKELYTLGKMTKQEYEGILLELLNINGFEFKK